MARRFTTVPAAASMICRMSPTSTSGSASAARNANSSELDVYASFHVPAGASLR
jgi:hypothetical protein